MWVIFKKKKKGEESRCKATNETNSLTKNSSLGLYYYLADIN